MNNSINWLDAVFAATNHRENLPKLGKNDLKSLNNIVLRSLEEGKIPQGKKLTKSMKNATKILEGEKTKGIASRLFGKIRGSKKKTLEETEKRLNQLDNHILQTVNSLNNDADLEVLVSLANGIEKEINARRLNNDYPTDLKLAYQNLLEKIPDTNEIKQRARNDDDINYLLGQKSLVNYNEDQAKVYFNKSTSHLRSLIALANLGDKDKVHSLQMIYGEGGDRINNVENGNDRQALKAYFHIAEETKEQSKPMDQV